MIKGRACDSQLLSAEVVDMSTF